MVVTNKEELECLREISQIVALARETGLKAVRPGITTKEIDDIIADILEKNEASPAPMVEYGFPGAACISINEVVAHGIPGEYVLVEGDLINIDVSAEKNGYYSDTGASIVVGHNQQLEALCKTAEEALYLGIKKAKKGAKLNQIGRTIHQFALDQGYTVLYNLTGHGVGRSLHEYPENVSNYRSKSETDLITEGLVLAIETFISTGQELVEEGDDGWSMITTDGSFVTQYEHTIVVTDGDPLILTILDEGFKQSSY